MIEVKGKYHTAVCYTPQLEKTAESQIKTVCDQEAFMEFGKLELAHLLSHPAAT